MNSKVVNDFKNFDFKTFSELLFSLSPYEFALIASILGFFIAIPLTINEQNSIGNFLELTGQVILTINAQASTLGPQSIDTTTFDDFKKQTEDKINLLINELNNLKKNL